MPARCLLADCVGEDSIDISGVIVTGVPGAMLRWLRWREFVRKVNGTVVTDVESPVEAIQLGVRQGFCG